MKIRRPITDKELNNLINSLGLISESFSNYGFHGSILIPLYRGRKKDLLKSIEIVIEYTEEEYPELERILKNAQGYIELHKESYLPVFPILSGIDCHDPEDVMKISF